MVEIHIMVKRYWFLDLAFGKGPTHAIITLLNGSSNAGMGLEELQKFFGLASLPFDKCDKSCKFRPHSPKFEASRNVGYLAVRLVDA